MEGDTIIDVRNRILNGTASKRDYERFGAVYSEKKSDASKVVQCRRCGGSGYEKTNGKTQNCSVCQGKGVYRL